VEFDVHTVISQCLISSILLTHNSCCYITHGCWQP